jgi:hypothetical protein
VSRELVTVAEAEAGFTRDSLAAAQKQLNEAIAAREALRDASIARIRAEAEGAAAKDEQADAASLDGAGEALDRLRQRRAAIEQDLRRSGLRFQELETHRRSAALEQAKLLRTEAAGSVLSRFRVTHCPACDQSLPLNPAPKGHCDVCRQLLPAADSEEEGRKRLEFERARASDQAQELERMAAVTTREIDRARHLLRDVDDEIEPLERRLLPVRRAAAWLLPPDLREHDEAIGRLRERLRQLGRIVSSLDVRDEYAREIDQLSRQIAALNAAVVLRSAQPAFAQIGDTLGEAMTDYLRRLEGDGRAHWADRQLAVSIDEHDVRIFVNGLPWQRALGSTQQAYFFFAYHYALLRLCRTEPFVYPGFVALDFPPDLSARLETSDQENYLLQPFVELLARPELGGAQLIAAGRALSGLKGAHRVPLEASYG